MDVITILDCGIHESRVARPCPICERARLEEAREVGVVRRELPVSTRYREEILRRYCAGEGPSSIARDLGIGVHVIQQVWNRAGRPARVVAGRPRSDVRAEAIRRYVAGETARDVGAALGVDPRTVYLWTRKSGARRTPKTSDTPGQKGRGGERVKLGDAAIARIRKAATLPGATQRSVCDATGFSLGAVQRYGFGGFDRRHSHVPKTKKIAAVLRIERGGERVEDVAREHGVSIVTVYRWIRVYGTR